MSVKKRYVSLLILGAMFLCMLPTAPAAMDSFSKKRTYANTFTDVSNSAWYYEDVKTAYELGLVDGTSASTFSPDSYVTVAQLLTLAARIHAAYYGNTIQEAGSLWYEKYVEYCADNIDARSGMDSRIAYVAEGNEREADQPAIRARFAGIMYAALPESEYQAINSIPDNSLPDVKDIQMGNAEIGIYELYRAGVLTGKDEFGTFSPNAKITRAEVAAIITRMVNPDQRKTFTLKPRVPTGPNLIKSFHGGPQRALNTFLNNFSQRAFEAYSEYDAERLIDFAFEYNVENNIYALQSKDSWNEGEVGIHKKVIADTIHNLFNVEITHQSTSKYTYQSSWYRIQYDKLLDTIAPNQNNCSVAEQMYDNGNGTYTVHFAIFHSNYDELPDDCKTYFIDVAESDENLFRGPSVTAVIGRKEEGGYYLISYVFDGY